jgi:predicted PurR-regulated permease PerM
VTSVFGGLYSFFAILVISFYLSVTRKGIDSFLGAVIPDKYEAYVIDLWKRSEAKVGRWLQGQLLLCLFVGLVVYVGLSIMGIKYALLLGLMAMILEIVPVVGPVIAAIPAVFFGFIEAPAMGFWMIVFYIVVQQIESNILVPIVLGKTIGLNPIVVLIALLVGNQLAGIPGMILSVPVSTILVEIFNDMSKQKESRRSLA